VHVAQITMGDELTKNAITIISGMSGSVDNPSFRPHVQIIDLLKAKHRNHYKVGNNL